MLKQKRYMNLFVIPLIGLMLISCTKGSPSDSEAEEIIHDFWEGDYEYTVYSKHGEGSEQSHGEVKGKLISDPYQQYEQAADASETQGIVEQYWYMQGENVVYNMKMSVSNRPDCWTTFESGAKGSDMYIKEDLAFTFDREETVSGRKVCVYRTQFEEEHVADYSQLPEEDGKVPEKFTLPFTMVMEYYIDFTEKEVVRIRLDGTDSARAAEIANLMYSGMTQEEAEEEFRENGSEETYEVIYDIKNFNGAVEIDPPEDLKEL